MEFAVITKSLSLSLLEVEIEIREEEGKRVEGASQFILFIFFFAGSLEV